MKNTKSEKFKQDQMIVKKEGEELIRELELRISNSDNIQKKLLETIHSEIFLILNTFKNPPQKRIISSYPHLIVESWDYSDELGIRLLNFNDMYSKLIEHQLQL